MKRPYGGQQGLWGVVDRLIPAELLAYEDEEALYKTRVLVCVSLASGITQSVVSLLIYLYRDVPIFHQVLVSCSALSAMVFLAIPWLFQRFHSFCIDLSLILH